ncbi:MAG: hypothetical protein U0575_00570 [Phycisphaerales bacterium]
MTLKRTAHAARRNARHAGHACDGSDAAGRGIEVDITIGPDGMLYFNDLPADLLPVAAALCPDDAALRRRIAIASALRGEGEA